MPVYPSGGTIAQSAGSPGFGPAPTPTYNASASVRLNTADTTSLSFTPSLAGSRSTWTIAFWAKRSLLATRQFLVSNYNSATTVGFVMEFDASDRLDIYDYTNPTYNQRLITTQVFRDVSAWYHFTVVLDTTQATNTNRFKLFVNGVQVTAFSTATYPAQFYQGNWNQIGFLSSFGKAGSYPGALYYYSGYFADMNFVDGLALTPSSFTATDANTGQLVPAQYTGSFGTNGCYLPFSGAALAVDLGQNQKTTAQDYPYWPMNTLLVDTTSTNGQQNNTFLDSSTNNFTITRNGNTTQGNFTPFNYGGGTTQANGYYSGYFSDAGAGVRYLTAPNSNASYAFSADFTVQAWVNTQTSTTAIAAYWTPGTATACSWIFSINATQFLTFSYGIGATNATITATVGVVPFNVWSHVAVSRSGSTLRLFLNGQLVHSATLSGALNNVPSNPLNIGRIQDGTAPFLGYLSNLQIVNGTALYTANFTVPTTPPTAISGTSLLTCQNSQFIDNSTNAFAITAFGNTQPSVVNPFGMTAWSGYFDGTGDYLSVADNTALDMGSSNFTMECWVYLNEAASSSDGIFAKRADIATYGGVLFYINSTTPALRATTNGSTWGVEISSSITIVVGTWNHLAITRSGSTWTIWVNGVSGATATLSGTVPDNSSAFVIAAYDSGGNASYIFPSGLISNARVVKGTAVYTSTFTPPTAPLTAISGTSLLTCQSSTFIDNSPNAFPITVNGNPYTGTLSNPFGNPVNSTPPVQAWSYSFDGTGDFISVPTNTNTNMHQNGDWTYEGWIYWNSMPTTGYQNVFGQGVAGQNSFGLTAYNGTSWSAPYYFVVNQANIGNVLVGKTVLVATTWYHFAVVRRSGVVTLYVNGLAEGTYSNSTNYAFGASPFTIGNSSNGYISNFRFVRRAVYTANFTPPTAPLTTIQNTQLLTCQSNRMVDNSLNNYTVTPNGNTTISPLSPFFPTQSWSAASYGGTMYFDGSDYLTAPHDASLSPTGNFTIEFWAYNTGSTAVQEWVTKGFGIQIYSFNSLWYAAFSSNNTTTYFVNASFGTSLFNTWQHIAVTRSGNTYTGFVNGVATSLGTSASAPGTGTSLFAAGVSIVGTPYYVTGYMSGLRVINGTALYTTPFVPPVLPPTAIANTSLLLNATNSGIYDATGQNVLETVGNAQVSTAVKKWGTSSVYFDGSGDYLVIPTTNAPCQFGTADFTIEAWIYSTSIANQQMILSNRIAATGTTNFGLQIYQSKVRMGNQNVDYLIGTITLSSNTWYHVAVSRVSGTFRLFINGVLDVANTSSQNMSSNSITVCGGDGTYSPTSYPFIGYIQDLRITKGVGRYSGAFTPPAAAFAYNQYDIGNQQWLPNNLSVTAGINQDNLVDSPSDYGTDTGLGGQVRGNYATMSPIDTVGGTFANGNLDVGVTAAAGRYIRATIAPPSGKWYWEATVLSTTGTPSVGVAATTAVPSGGVPVIGVTYSSNAVVTKDSTNLGTQTAWSVNNVVGIAYDADNLTIALYLNNALQTTVNLTTGYTYAPLFMSYANVTATSAVAFNFGQRAFAYTAPTGFKCLVSTNLPTPTIGATSTTQADDYFNVNTWTGNGSQVTVGFNPELLWYKSTNAVDYTGVVDVLRGDTKYLQTWTTNAEGTTAGLLTKNSTGFVPGTAFSTNSYVSWSWKANGAGVANTAGTIASTVSANTTNGCSIVSFSFPAVASKTVGHGLGVSPSFIVVKSLSNGTQQWITYHSSLGNTGFLCLNKTDGFATNSSVWDNTSPTSTVFTLGSGFTSANYGANGIAYCFAPVSGFSAMGVYTGNGAADGPMIYTNFRPAFVMVKNTVTAATSNWVMKDELRAANYNPATGNLYANLNNAQDVTATVEIDLLSNGFKVRGTYAGINGSGNSIVYIAFAEFPFKYSRAR